MLTYNEQKPLPHSQGLGQETILCQQVFNSKEHRLSLVSGVANTHTLACAYIQVRVYI